MPGIGTLVFSRDRPLQLDGMLRSARLHRRDPAGTVSCVVLYKATGDDMEAMYGELREAHPEVGFHREGDFRRDVTGIVEGWEHVVFQVDDNLWIRPHSFRAAADLLDDRADLLGVSFRLGANTAHCYPLDAAQALPAFTRERDDLLTYDWSTARLDFGYALEVSASAYRVADLLPLLRASRFGDPNTLEEALAGGRDAFRASRPRLGCPERSQVFSIPCNRVQTVLENRSGADPRHSPENLARAFREGWRIRPQAYTALPASSCHMEIPLVLEMPGEDRPEVSVIVPCHRQTRFLEEAVQSVLDQGFRDWELIVVDDGCPDGSAELAESIAARHPDRAIRVIRQENAGVAAARNAGARAARGRCILPLDCDDRLAPTYLAATVSALRDNPDAAIVFTDIRHFGGRSDHYVCGPATLEVELHDNRLPYCCLYRREVFDSLGGYDTRFPAYEDWDFWLGALRLGWKAVHVREALFHYRKWGGGLLAWADPRRDGLIRRLREKHLPRRRGRDGDPPGRRALVCCPYYHPSRGGAENAAAGIVAALVSDGWEVDVLTGKLPERREHAFQGARILEHGGPPWDTRRHPRYSAEIRRRIESGRYRACLLLADPENWVLWGLEAAGIPPGTRVYVQPLINGDGFRRWGCNGHLRRRVRHALGKASRLVVLTERGPDAAVCREFGLDGARIPNAVEPLPPAGGFRGLHGIPDDVFLMLVVANLWPVKNHDGLLESLRGLEGDWRLVLVGGPSEDMDHVRRVEALCREDGRVLRLGSLPAGEVASAIAACDLLLLPSHGEVAPLSLLEAMALGRPWLASYGCGGALDYAGGVVMPFRAFPAAIRALWRDPALRQALGALGREHWQACHRRARVDAAWQRLFRGEAPGRGEFAPPQGLSDRQRALRLRLVAHLSGIDPGDRARDETLSFCIIADGRREPALDRLIASIRAQGLPGSEIIVAGVCRERPGVRRVLLEEDAADGRLSRLRNAAAAASNGTILVFCDDDVVLADNWGAEVLAAMADAEIVVGRLLNPDGSRHWDWTTIRKTADGIDQSMLPYGMYDDDLYLTSGVLAVRRQVWEAVRWDETLAYRHGEDVDFSQRAMAAGFHPVIRTGACAEHADPRYMQTTPCRTQNVRECDTLRLLYLCWRAYRNGDPVILRRLLEQGRARLRGGALGRLTGKAPPPGTG